MKEKLVLIVCAFGAIGIVTCSEIQIASVISSADTRNKVIIPQELNNFFLDFKRATSKDLLPLLTGDDTSYVPVASDWDTVVYLMHKYVDVALFALINIYPSLPDSENKIFIHNAVMRLLEEHKADDERIRMLFDMRSQEKSDLRSHVQMLTKCNPYLAMFNWLSDSPNAQSDSERLQSPQITNFTDILMVFNNYPEKYWETLLPETHDDALTTQAVMSRINEKFKDHYKLINFTEAIDFIDSIPEHSIGNKVKKVAFYNALLAAAQTNGQGDVYEHYFDVALAFDKFVRTVNAENNYLKNLLMSVMHSRDDCYRSVMDGNRVMIKNEKYDEYMYTEPSAYSEKSIIENPIFSLRNTNRTLGIHWIIDVKNNLFWLRNTDYFGYMDTTRCDHIHSTIAQTAPDSLALKIFPYGGQDGDRGRCRIMNAETKHFLAATDFYLDEEDTERRLILCGRTDAGLDRDAYNWRFEAYKDV